MPCVMVSGLVEEQGQPGVEFDRIDIKKLISNWDAMAGDGSSEQPGLGGGWGGAVGGGGGAVQSSSKKHRCLKARS